MIVLDASAVLELILRSPRGERVKDRIAPAAETLHAPDLLDLEVAQLLRRYEEMGNLTASSARAALDDLADLDAERYPHDLFLPRIWELRKNATAYNASYLALAEALEAPLLTADRRMASMPGHHARVEVLR